MKTVREQVIDLDRQDDPIREALRRMLAEFGDEHYDSCPAAITDDGLCDCFAGSLVKDCLAALLGGSKP